MNFDIHPRTIYITIVGSHSYGTARPESDVDIRGIAIPPHEYFHGYANTFAQFEAEYPRRAMVGGETIHTRLERMVGRMIPDGERLDSTIYGLRKFFKLAADCNPNIIEFLYADPCCHVLTTSYSDTLIQNRHLFLSTKARFTFSGYAHSQLKRIRTHRRWLLNPPTHKPTREEFRLALRTVIPKDQLQAAESLIKKKVDSWILLNEELPREVLEAVRRETLASITEMWEATRMLAPLDDDGEFDRDRLEHAAGRLLGFDDNFLEYLDRERRYKSALRQYKQYESWKKGRNHARAELEARFGYDCYTDDTEFLTPEGWRRFDDVGTLPLATVNKELKIEFQNPVDRFDGCFSGNLYLLEGQHMDVAVTPNHRMLFRKVERKSGKEYPWVLDEVSLLPDTFDVIRAISPRTSTFRNDELANLPIPQLAAMRLMGWYVSDGSALFRKSGQPKDVRISQKPGGKLHWSMSRFMSDHGRRAQASLYRYARKPSSFRSQESEELILSVRQNDLVEFLVGNCGSRNKKRIPRWAFSLSRRLMSEFVRAACGGDGYKRKHVTKPDSFTYYSSSEYLADDIQEMSFMCGWETAKWGPYVGEDGKLMWQVHIRDDIGKFKRCVRSKNLRTKHVSDIRIVCFSVPNRTLVVRRNGKIAIHGNSKHASHLVRLLRMAKEILSSGQVIVKRPDADELLAIRNGEWTFDRLMEWATRANEELTNLYETGESPLPKKPNQEKLDELCVSLVERALVEDELR